MRIKRLSVIITAIIITMVSVTGCGNKNSVVSTDNEKYPKMKIRLTTNGTSIANDTKTAKLFADIVRERSGGNIDITVFSDDQLAGGNMSKGVEMVAQGATEISAYATSVLAALDQRLMVGALPWLFNDYKHASEVIDKTGGKYYAKLLKPKGLHYLASTHNGFRQVSNSKRPINKPEDIKGLKIRIPGGEIYREFWQAFKADPIAMSWSEVYTALQQGTIDGQENGFSVTNSANVFEVQPYMTRWNYTYEQYLFIANQKFWDKLNKPTQELFEQASREACQWGRNQVEDEETALIKKFEKAGVQIYQPTPKELEPFKKVVAPMKEKYAKLYGKEAAEAFHLND